MKIEIRHHGKIKEGKLIWEVPELYRQNILELEGQEITMVIKKRHNKPTPSQYGYYRGAILMSCFQSEMFSSMDSKDAIHELYFAPKFLSYVTLAEIGGKPIEVKRVRSLADLHKDEVTEFISRVLEECRELGVDVPPSEIFYSKYYNK